MIELMWVYLASSSGKVAYVLPLAGNPTVAIAILPEWKSRPDSVL